MTSNSPATASILPIKIRDAIHSISMLRISQVGFYPTKDLTDSHTTHLTLFYFTFYKPVTFNLLITNHPLRYRPLPLRAEGRTIHDRGQTPQSRHRTYSPVSGSLICDVGLYITFIRNPLIGS